MVQDLPSGSSRAWAVHVRLCLLFIAALVCNVSGNTETINIVATQADDVIFSQSSSWPVFSPGSAEYLWRYKPAPLDTPLQSVCALRQEPPCEHEIWAILDLDSYGWESFHKFTLRISWPAFYPTDFLMETFSPQEAFAVLSQTLPGSSLPQSPPPASRKTRRQYVRIRFVDTGVRVPSKRNITVEATPFMILLEPLYFTVLPALVVPTLLFLLPVVLVASFVIAPRIHSCLRAIAEDVRLESRITSSQKQE
ncbi:hypothetical protein BDY19DRAFT_915772 [Irpex rosettiformis]|uniref:Uncharacterized protein n=1 Tax=Irpex rosettiformis TaxID=378272 RepID=A0ACB8UN89_9APHY|nr:hypothetical protein BDY19DRAFT_915772 [Irpex rosettiformis]